MTAVHSSNAVAAEVGMLKYHGLGNDFVILIEPTACAATSAPAPPGDRGPFARGAAVAWADLAAAVCDRRTGLGADGFIRATRAEVGAAAPWQMELRNADGGLAEMSGNGIRCLARALADESFESAKEFTIATGAGLRSVMIDSDGQVEVTMGAVKMSPGPVLASHERSWFVDVGNPHVVVAVDDPAGVDLARLAAQVGEVNLEVVAPDPTRTGRVRMRVNERGVGETQACGTGSVAAAAAARKWGWVGTVVSVAQPGGVLGVDLTRDQAVLRGPAVRVASATFVYRTQRA
ncbi:MAG: diaminopimelate epimerase [Acidimicrobiales bacterium]